MTLNQPGLVSARRPTSNVATRAPGQASDLSPVSWRAVARVVARIVGPAGRALTRVLVSIRTPRLAALSVSRPTRVVHPPIMYRADHSGAPAAAAPGRTRLKVVPG